MSTHVRAQAAAALLLAAAAMTGCDATSGGPVEGPVSVYVSLPLTGPDAPEGRDAADGARLALEQAGGRAGDLQVEAVFLDDARGSSWDPGAVGANARRATGDSSAVAYVGELGSAATRASLPITNDARLVQISPGASAVDLTRAAQGYPRSPERYRPSGDPSFARVVPDDARAARGLVNLVGELGISRAALVSDGTPFGEAMSDELAGAAAEAGVQITRGEGAGPTLEATDRDGLRLLEDDIYSVSAQVEPAGLPEGSFATAFRDRFERAPLPAAAYGYEAMALALAAVESADRDSDSFRGAVADAVLGADRRDSVLGPYSITGDGDSTLCRVQLYRIESDRSVPLGAPCVSD